MKKIALLTGITGQVGSYLADLLLEKGYEVHGVVRRTSNPLDKNIKHLAGKIKVHYGDLTDGGSLHIIIQETKPHEIYNLAAMSDVRRSFDMPVLTMDINCGGLLRIIESVRQLNHECRIYHASTSEMFGRVQETPQKETTPFYPLSPYAVSKVAAFDMARAYREAYGMKIYTGILFNTESPRRGEEFLTKKVCKGVAEIVNGKIDKIVLGNLDAYRDFGYAVDYVEWIWRIIQHDEPGEFIIATGEMHSVREVVEEAFKFVGISEWEKYIGCDKSLLRPGEVDLLIGDSSKSQRVLGYSPKVKFKELIQIMMQHELNKFK